MGEAQLAIYYAVAKSALSGRCAATRIVAVSSINKARDFAPAHHHIGL